MAVRRGIESGPRAIRNAGPGRFEKQLQGQVDLAAQERIAGIESRAINVVLRKAQHQTGVAAPERQRREHAPQACGMAEEDLGRRVAGNIQSLRTDPFHNGPRIHVAGERQKGGRVTGGHCLAEAPDIVATPTTLHHLRMTHLAGRAAERLICGMPSAGAGGPDDSDLALAMRFALAEEVSFGLGSFGPLWLGADPEPALFLRLPAPSQQAIRARLERAEADATRILAANRALLLELAGTLAHQHRLAGPELDALLTRVVPLPAPDGDADADTEDKHNATSPFAAASGADPAPQA